MLLAHGAATSCRNICVTRKGYVGMAPEAAGAGDAIYAFVGGQVLYALRVEHKAGTRVEFLGEAYVHGLMDGEVMGWVRGGGASGLWILLLVEV